MNKLKSFTEYMVTVERIGMDRYQNRFSICTRWPHQNAFYPSMFLLKSVFTKASLNFNHIRGKCHKDAICLKMSDSVLLGIS